MSTQESPPGGDNSDKVRSEFEKSNSDEIEIERNELRQRLKPLIAPLLSKAKTEIRNAVRIKVLDRPLVDLERMVEDATHRQVTVENLLCNEVSPQDYPEDEQENATPETNSPAKVVLTVKDYKNKTSSKTNSLKKEIIDSTKTVVAKKNSTPTTAAEKKDYSSPKLSGKYSGKELAGEWSDKPGVSGLKHVRKEPEPMDVDKPETAKSGNGNAGLASGNNTPIQISITSNDADKRMRFAGLLAKEQITNTAFHKGLNRIFSGVPKCVFRFESPNGETISRLEDLATNAGIKDVAISEKKPLILSFWVSEEVRAVKYLPLDELAEGISIINELSF